MSLSDNDDTWGAQQCQVQNFNQQCWDYNNEQRYVAWSWPNSPVSPLSSYWFGLPQLPTTLP
jgi:hypothetical protein